MNCQSIGKEKGKVHDCYKNNNMAPFNKTQTICLSENVSKKVV